MDFFYKLIAAPGYDVRLLSPMMLCPLAVIIHGYMGYRYLYSHTTSKRYLLVWRFSWCLLSAYTVYVIFTALYLVPNSIIPLHVHLANIAVVALVFVLLHSIRSAIAVVDDRITSANKQWNPVLTRSVLLKNLNDCTQNVLGYTVCYVATFSISPVLGLAGVMLAALSVWRVLGFRIYDDFFRYVRDPSKRKLKDARLSLLQGIFDLVPRIYVYTILSFACIQLILMRNPLYDSKGPIDDHFVVLSSSGNPFADFIYYNVVTLSTTGYGDIIPKTVLAKGLTTIEILFGMIVLASLAAIIVSRAQSSFSQVKKLGETKS